MHATSTTLSSWVRAIRKALDAAGCDSAALLAEAGLDPRLLDDPNGRYPLDQTTRLWALAREHTRDPCIGLKVASQVTQGTFHALGYTLPASRTLREAFERIVRYFRIVSDVGELEFRRDGGEYHFLIHPPPRGAQPAPEAIDAFMSVFVRMCRAFGGRELAPLRVELRRAAPADTACFDAILRAPVRFGAPLNRLVYAAAAMEHPLEGANPELASHHDEIARRYLARFDRANVVAQVEAALLERLPHGEPAQDDIARALHLSVRSLQRKLAEQGTTFQALLDGTRKELALSYLRDRDYSVSEVTYLLGFSDTSSFSRACKRWTGQLPSEIRKGD
jgi:AraC-like DNA-binding protein